MPKVAKKKKKKKTKSSAARKDDKESAIKALQSNRNAGEDAEIALRLANKQDEANSVWERTSRLSREIDILIGKMMEDWVNQTATHAATLIQIRGEIDVSVAKIKTDQDTANQVVGILGLLDDALQIAMKVAKAVA